MIKNGNYFVQCLIVCKRKEHFISNLLEIQLYLTKTDCYYKNYSFIIKQNNIEHAVLNY